MEDEDSLSCSVCSQVCKRAVLVSCCNARACRVCAVKQITKDRKCWRDECGSALATKDMKNDEKTREKIDLLTDVALIQCSVCGEICKRGISLGCCGAKACRTCGVKSITASRKCWVESCGETQTSNGLVNDNVLRAAVESFKNNEIMEWSQVKQLKTKVKKASGKDKSEVDSLPAPVPSQKEPAKIDKRKNVVNESKNGGKNVSKKSRDSFDDLPPPVPSQETNKKQPSPVKSGSKDSPKKVDGNMKVKKDLLNSQMQQYKSLELNIKKGKMFGKEKFKAKKRLKDLDNSIQKTKREIEKMENSTESGPEEFLILPNSQSILQKKMDSTSPFVMAVLGLEFLVEIPRGPIHCQLCNQSEKLTSIFEHLQAATHRLKYIEKFFPTVHKKFQKNPNLKDWVGESFRVLEKATEKIEASRGRLRPITVASEEAYKKNLGKIRTMIEKGEHFGENDSPNIPYDFESLSDPFPIEEKPSREEERMAGRRGQKDKDPRNRDRDQDRNEDPRVKENQQFTRDRQFGKNSLEGDGMDQKNSRLQQMAGFGGENVWGGRSGRNDEFSRRPGSDIGRDDMDRSDGGRERRENDRMRGGRDSDRFDGGRGGKDNDRFDGGRGGRENDRFDGGRGGRDDRMDGGRGGRENERFDGGRGGRENERFDGGLVGRENDRMGGGMENDRFSGGMEGVRFGRFEGRDGGREEERGMFSRRGDMDMFSRRDDRDDGLKKDDRDGGLRRDDRDEIPKRDDRDIKGSRRDERDPRRNGDREKQEREMAREKDRLRREREKMGQSPVRDERRNRSPPSDRKRKRSVSPFSAAIENFKRFKQAEDVMLEGIRRKNQIFDRRPEDHPKYPEEWRTFWHKRYSEVQAEGKDPNTHDYNTEWVPFWKKRVTDLIDEEVLKNQKALMKQFGLNSVQPPRRDQFKENLEDHHNSSSSNRNRSRSPRRSSPKKRVERDYSDVQLIPALRLLSTLDTDLGDLGPDVNKFMVQAMNEEQGKEGGSNALLDDAKFIDLMEEVKGKLNDQVGSGQLDEAKEHVVQLCLDHLTKIVKCGRTVVTSVRSSPRRERSNSPASVVSVHESRRRVEVEKPKEVVKEVKEVDPKALIAESIATVLMFFNCGDVADYQLEMIVEMLLRKTAKDDKITPAGKLANEFMASFSPTESLLKSEEKVKREEDLKREEIKKQEEESKEREEIKKQEDSVSLPEKQVDHEVESSDVFNDFTDDEMIALLRSFKSLSKTEQQNLVSYMKNLEKTDPMKVKLLRNKVGSSSQKPEDEIAAKNVNNYSFNNGNNSMNLEAGINQRRGRDSFGGGFGDRPEMSWGQTGSVLGQTGSEDNNGMNQGRWGQQRTSNTSGQQRGGGREQNKGDGRRFFN